LNATQISPQKRPETTTCATPHTGLRVCGASHAITEELSRTWPLTRRSAQWRRLSRTEAAIPTRRLRMENRVRIHRLAQRGCVVVRPRLPVPRRRCLLHGPLASGADPTDPCHPHPDVPRQELQ